MLRTATESLLDQTLARTQPIGVFAVATRDPLGMAPMTTPYMVFITSSMCTLSLLIHRLETVLLVKAADVLTVGGGASPP